MGSPPGGSVPQPPPNPDLRGAIHGRRACTHLHTRRSETAKAAGAPARRTSNSCCSEGLRGPGEGAERAERWGAGGQEGCEPGRLGRARSSRGSRVHPGVCVPEPRCKLLAAALSRRLLFLAASRAHGGAAPPSWPGSCSVARCSGRGLNCRWLRLPARMLPAHSRGCIL